MNAYVVIFTPGPGRDPYETPYLPLHQAIESLRSLLISVSSGLTYIVLSPDSIDDIHKQLYLHNDSKFGKEDRLYIVAACKPFKGYMPDNARRWLEANLPGQDAEDG